MSICSRIGALLRRGQHPKTLQQRFPQYAIGRGSYAGALKIWDWGEGATLSIGNYCSIAEDVQIFLGGEHRTDWATTYPFNVLWPQGQFIQGHPKTKGDVVIGHDVWIGTRAMIMSGVTLGHGCVVGAGSVVTKCAPLFDCCRESRAPRQAALCGRDGPKAPADGLVGLARGTHCKLPPVATQQRCGPLSRRGGGPVAVSFPGPSAFILNIDTAQPTP